jgi:hypothetical protein
MTEELSCVPMRQAGDDLAAVAVTMRRAIESCSSMISTIGHYAVIHPGEGGSLPRR